MLDVAETFRGAGGSDEAIFQVYRRHREHIWTEHAINHVEEALEGQGCTSGCRSHGGRPVRWLGDGGDVPLPEPLGAVDLKGVAKPLPLYQAVRTSASSRG